MPRSTTSTFFFHASTLFALLLAVAALGCDGDGQVPGGGDGGLDGATPDGGATDPDGAAPDAHTADAGPPVLACTSDDECAADRYCRFLEGCGGDGTCEPRPSACTREYVPVCGCDGTTYANACNVASAGVNIASPGECGGLPTCIRNDQCGRREYCEGDSCGGTGRCATRPEACTEEAAPVCGCDGLTYGNPCLAAQAGVRVAADGPCGSTTGCTDNAGCNPTDYCEGVSCDGAGACVPRPEACSREYAPVCGCDGATYSNGCEAARAGVRVASPGECSPDTDCLTNRECADVDYCAAEACGGRGTCTMRPEVCVGLYDPVCGCDGATYGNTCTAASAGVRVAYAGECGSTLGCATNDDCPRDAYCEGRSCGGVGHCEPHPSGCPDLYDPVCGCDGHTYGNACDAAAAGVRVATVGECPTSGCRTNAECGDREYCGGATCDGLGACEIRPDICPLVIDPVCGCDGRTYNNSCEAAGAGVRVSHHGPCGSSSDECTTDRDCSGRDYCAECRGTDGPIRVCLPRGSAC